ncbi:DUF1490 family protein [Actinomycetospora rhizophila]|uniref:DUF1490 family protein n=1 Tax=Actinomycetospora rhizophila TaxID=1416876 RepID=A0ABV9ZCB2_9PSEU
MTAWAGLAARAAGTIATGVVGVAVVEGVRKIATGARLHDAAVTVTTAGLRGARAAEAGAERVRLSAGDIVAEARGRLGEEAPAPGAGANGHDHEH